jgi:hypothetical protein
MNCADVCLDHDFDNENEFYVEAPVRVRKAHACCECGDAIVPGVNYIRASGKSDGQVWMAKTCAACYEIRRAFVCGSWQFGKLWTSIEEGLFPIWNEKGPIDCLAKLDSRESRDKCRARYSEWGREARP